MSHRNNTTWQTVTLTIRVEALMRCGVRTKESVTELATHQTEVMAGLYEDA